MQGVEPCGDGQLGVAPQCGEPLGVHPELGRKVELAPTGRELDDVGRAVDALEHRRAVVALHQPGDVAFGDLVPPRRGDDVDELLAVQDAGHVGVVEDLCGARQAERRPRDDDRLGERGRLAVGPLPRVDPTGPVEELREQVPQLEVRALVGRRPWRGDGAHHLGRGRATRRCRRRGGARNGRDLGHAAHAEPRGVEAAQGVVERHHATALGVVGEEVEHVVVTQHVAGEPLQCPLGADLDEGGRPRGAERAQTGHELHRRGDLVGEQVEHLRHHVGAHRVEVAGDVGDDGQDRRVQLQALERGPQGRAGRRHDGGVEGVAHRQSDSPVPAFLTGDDGVLDRVGGAADDGLGGGVHVGEHHVALEPVHEALGLVERCGHGGQGPVVVDLEARHLLAPGADGLERRREIECSRCGQCAVLAQAVAHHQVGHDAVGLEQAGDGRVDRKHRRLGDLGLAQLCLGGGHRVGIFGVDEDVVGERPAAQQRGHHLVGLGEGLGNDGLDVTQVGEHVDVLRALAGVQERGRGRRPVATEHAAPSQHPPGGGDALVDRPQRPLDPIGELGRVAVVDRHPFGGTERILVRSLRCRRTTGPCLDQCGSEPIGQFGLVGRADHECAAQRRFRLGARRGRCARQVSAGHHRPATVGSEATRDVLLEHDVEVGPAEAERAHPGHPGIAVAWRPVAQLGVDREGRGREVDVGVRCREVEAGRQPSVVQRQDRLQQAGRPGRPLEVADVGLHRAECDRSRRQARAGECLTDARDLDHVADSGRGAVTLHQAAGRGRQPGALPRPLHRETLTHGVRRGDALASAVAGAGHAAHHRIDPVAVTFGVGQALQHEDGRALAHHEPVGTVGVGASARRRECTDLGELHEGGSAHVAVHASGEGHVEVVLEQAVDGRSHGRHRRGTCGIGHEVRAVEIEQVGDPAGQAVAELARHRVLGDAGQPGIEVRVKLGLDRVAQRPIERGERGCLRELAGQLGERDPQRRQVVLLARHGVAEDHRGPLTGKVPVGPAVVEQRHTGACDRPLLGVVHGVGHRRRDGESPTQRVPLPVGDPPTDLRVGLLWGFRVGVEVERRVPASGVDLADRVAGAGHVLPERGGGGGVGQDGAHPHDSDGLGGGFGHGCASPFRLGRRDGRPAGRRRPAVRPGRHARRSGATPTTTWRVSRHPRPPPPSAGRRSRW